MVKDSNRQYEAAQELKKQRQSEAQKRVQEKRKATVVWLLSRNSFFRGALVMLYF